MAVQNITGLSVEQFLTHIEHKKLVLIHPWSKLRKVYLAYYLAYADSNLLYYRFQGAELKLEAWLKQLADGLDQSQPEFSPKLISTLSSGDPMQMAEALAQDLAALQQQTGQSLNLFLDEFDRVISDHRLQAFIKALLDSLTHDIQMICCARRFSLEIWYEPLASGDLALLGTERRENDGMFTLETQQRPQIEVYAFGRGHVFVNGQGIVQWDGALPRNLFFYLMDHPLTTRDEIFDVFWPNLSIKEATNVFHVTKRKVSECLGRPIDDVDSYELTHYNSGFYRPSDKFRRHYDVDEFENAIEQSLVAVNDDAEKKLLMRAIALYQGPFLSTVAMSWCIERRMALQQAYVQALVSLARLHKRQNNWRFALGYYVRALKEIPEREDVHRAVMAIYLQQGMQEDAARQYRVLESIIGETLHISPDPETQALFQQIYS